MDPKSRGTQADASCDVVGSRLAEATLCRIRPTAGKAPNTTVRYALVSKSAHLQMRFPLAFCHARLLHPHAAVMQLPARPFPRAAAPVGPCRRLAAHPSLPLVALCSAPICCPHPRVRQPSSCRITAAIVCPTRQLPSVDSPSRPHTRHAQRTQQPRQSRPSKSNGFFKTPSSWRPSTAAVVASERLVPLLNLALLVSQAEPLLAHFPKRASQA